MPKIALTRAQAVLLFLVAILLIAPLFFPSSFYYRIGALIAINAIAVLGLVILLGFAGQISLGHAGFSGIGAYCCAILPAQIGLPPILALILGAVFSGLLAWFIGRPILRMRGHYLAVVTLGFGILVNMVLVNEVQWTGGPDGITVQALGLKELLKDMGIKVKSSVLWYWLSGFILLVGAWIALNLFNSPTGRALRSLHDSEVAARVVGVNVPRYKLIAFVISAIYASIAGSLIALFNKFVTPDVSSFLHSVELVTMAVLGGIGSVLGGIFGAAFLTSLPQALTIFQEYEHLLLGLIMMLVMIFMRDGAIPGLTVLLEKYVPQLKLPNNDIPRPTPKPFEGETP